MPYPTKHVIGTDSIAADDDLVEYMKLIIGEVRMVLSSFSENLLNSSSIPIYHGSRLAVDTAVPTICPPSKLDIQPSMCSSLISPWLTIASIPLRI
jgi:hypothetical protein